MATKMARMAGVARHRHRRYVIAKPTTSPLAANRKHLVLLDAKVPQAEHSRMLSYSEWGKQGEITTKLV